ncbi:DUF167 domain-containing protein [Candidatus Saccharibacteria bacterium]|nr:DUF167 domain-containing protein [Candidatus Saccharibacteria bacterium]
MAIYSVTVKTGTSQEKVVEVSPTELIIYLRAKPHDGEANSALIKILSKHFHVAKTNIEIKKGAKSHTKLIEIS